VPDFAPTKIGPKKQLYLALMSDRKQPGKGAERGVLSVELAIILPFFGLLLLGVMELGGIARDHQTLQNAAREGAQFAARSSNRIVGVTSKEVTTIQTSIKNRVIAYLANEKLHVSAGDIVVNQSRAVTVGTITVQSSEVTITYNRPLIFPGISRWVSLGTTVQGKALFRNLY
jgi:Flp pilus assembly protein TadG